MKRQVTAVFEDGGDGWITAYIEEVPGAVTQGRTIDEAVRRAKRFVEARLRRAARLGGGRAVLDLRQGNASSRLHGA